MRRALAVAAAVVCLSRAGEDDHRYVRKDEIIIWNNKVGPYDNPQETYDYFSLPFCKPKELESFKEHGKYAGIGEILEGNELSPSGMRARFKEKSASSILCSSVLSPQDVEKFSYAIENHYWFQLYVDDLPVWGMVGVETQQSDDAKNEKKFLVYSHKSFSIGYKNDRVIEVNLTSENPIPIEVGRKMELSYSVDWVESRVPFEKRFNRYLDYSFFEHQIHWFSIFNSFMMVLFLVGVVGLILTRTLHKDYARLDDEEHSSSTGEHFGDDGGWKQISGDVFRTPNRVGLLSALFGIGVQMMFLVVGTVVLAIVGTLYVDRGALVSATLVVYSLTSVVGGYASGAYFKSFESATAASKNHSSRRNRRSSDSASAKKHDSAWIRVMIATATLFPLTTASVVFVLNVLAVSYRTSNTISAYSLFVVLLILLLVSLPLTVLGTVLGRNSFNENNNNRRHHRVNALPRPIPPIKTVWQDPTLTIFLTGILPFGSIFIEMYFVFTSFWNYKFYYVYGFLLLVFTILIVVSACVTVVYTYFSLNSENWKWRWNSFLASASTAVYVYAYAIYYFFAKTNMNGLLQTAFYFGWMFLFSLALGLLCGAVGLMASTLFVRRIYSELKED